MSKQPLGSVQELHLAATRPMSAYVEGERIRLCGGASGKITTQWGIMMRDATALQPWFKVIGSISS